MSIQDRAREFVDQHVKTLPIAVRLSGITEAEKNEAASLCADFAAIAVREFIEKVRTEAQDLARRGVARKRVENADALLTPYPYAIQQTFREMFHKELDG